MFDYEHLDMAFCGKCLPMIFQATYKFQTMLEGLMEH